MNPILYLCMSGGRWCPAGIGGLLRMILVLTLTFVLFSSLPSVVHSFLPSFLPFFHRSFMFVPSLVLLVACSLYCYVCATTHDPPYSKPNLCVGLLEALVPPKDDDTERAKTLTKKQMKAIDGASIFVSAPTLLLFLEHNDELAEAEKEAA